MPSRSQRSFVPVPVHSRNPKVLYIRFILRFLLLENCDWLILNTEFCFCSVQRCRFYTNYPHGSCETVREFPMFGDLGATLQAVLRSLASAGKDVRVVTGCRARRGYFSVLIIWLRRFGWLLSVFLFLLPVRTTERAGFLQMLLRKCHLQNQTLTKGITLAKFHKLSCACPLMTT